MKKDFKASFDNGVLTIVFPKDKVVSTLEEKSRLQSNGLHNKRGYQKPKWLLGILLYY